MKLRYYNTRYTVPLFLLLLIVGSGCKKFITVDAPVTSINAKNIYSTDATAISVLTNLYANMSLQNSESLAGGGISSLGLYAGLSADEITMFSGTTNTTLIAYYQNKLNNVITGGTDFWTAFYIKIFVVNSAIEGLNGSSTLTPLVKNQLLGEAYFMRAFYYFYLVNLYGDVPLILSTDYSKNSIQGRTVESDIYLKMKEDLIKSQGLMMDKFYDASLINQTTERIRPNKTTATALLARVYLFNNEWANAELEATKVIKNTGIYDIEPDVNNVFLMNSMETIWSLQSVNINERANTGEGFTYILTSPPDENLHPFYLDDHLVESFQNNDLRYNNWINSYTDNSIIYHYAYKYKLGSADVSTGEYLILFRVAEQYLIRSEARAQLTNLSGSISDIDVIRKRAGLLLIKDINPNIEKVELLSMILQERRHELFTEWGHRWLDLKRTNTLDGIMTVVTPLKSDNTNIWDSRWALYPIPLESLQKGINIVQNPGY